MQDLTGRVAWLTGAGSGIGEAGARALAALGVHVVLSGRRPDPLESVAAGISAAGGSAEVCPLDVTDKAAVLRVVDEIDDRHGRLDVLVNSAGLNSLERNWHDATIEDWETTLRVDLDGAFYCTKAVIPLMKRQGGGLLIHISSWAGKYVSPVTGPAYSAAKHALNAMSESLNMELCLDGIRSCALCPGEVSTPILDRRPIPVSEKQRARMIQPDDMGEVIAFLARLPAHVCINELTISPTWNRSYVPQAKMIASLEARRHPYD